VLCDELEGWDGGRAVRGRLEREWMYVHLQMTHATVQQKLMQHCKSIIL